MKCTNCQAEIEAKWKHAVASNICPFCGEKIFSDELGSVLATSKVLFDSIQEQFKYNFEDWLMANYGYVNVKTLKTKIEEKDRIYLEKVKTLSKDLFNFVASGSLPTMAQNQPQSKVDVKLNPVEMDETSMQIRKNAGIDAMEQRRKEAIGKIKQAGSGGGASSLVVDSELTPADSDEIEMAAKMVSDYSSSIMVNGPINSEDSDNEVLYSQVQAMSRGGSAKDVDLLQRQIRKSQGRSVKGKV